MDGRSRECADTMETQTAMPVLQWEWLGMSAKDSRGVLYTLQTQPLEIHVKEPKNILRWVQIWVISRTFTMSLSGHDLRSIHGDIAEPHQNYLTLFKQNLI